MPQVKCYLLWHTRSPHASCGWDSILSHPHSYYSATCSYPQATKTLIHRWLHTPVRKHMLYISGAKENQVCAKCAVSSASSLTMRNSRLISQLFHYTSGDSMLQVRLPSSSLAVQSLLICSVTMPQMHWMHLPSAPCQPGQALPGRGTVQARSRCGTRRRAARW